MKNLLLTSFCLILFATSSYAQDFDSAVGLRLGYPMSVTYKKFISESSAIEAYGGFRSYGGVVNTLSVHGAYQIHKDIDEIDNLQYYYGGGAAAFFWSGTGFNGTTSFAVQGYIGLSYTLEDTPVNVSLDWIPTFLIKDGLGGFGNGFGSGYGSLGVRYVLGGGSNDN